MKKILFIILLIPILIVGRHNINYEINIKNAKCIDSKRPCKKYKQKDGTIVKLYKDRIVAQLKSGIKIVDYSNKKRVISYPNGKKVVRDSDYPALGC
jgi:hypothetical protein